MALYEWVMPFQFAHINQNKKINAIIWINVRQYLTSVVIPCTGMQCVKTQDTWK